MTCAPVGLTRVQNSFTAYFRCPLIAVCMQELACVDLSMEIAERSLEVVRSSIEAAAARERDEAAARLLSELELEDASKKVHFLSCCASWRLSISAGHPLSSQEGQTMEIVRPREWDNLKCGHDCM